MPVCVCFNMWGGTHVWMGTCVYLRVETTGLTTGVYLDLHMYYIEAGSPFELVLGFICLCLLHMLWSQAGRHTHLAFYMDSRHATSLMCCRLSEFVERCAGCWSKGILGENPPKMHFPAVWIDYRSSTLATDGFFQTSQNETKHNQQPSKHQYQP